MSKNTHKLWADAINRQQYSRNWKQFSDVKLVQSWNCKVGSTSCLIQIQSVVLSQACGSSKSACRISKVDISYESWQHSSTSNSHWYQCKFEVLELLPTLSKCHHVRARVCVTFMIVGNLRRELFVKMVLFANVSGYERHTLCNL